MNKFNILILLVLLLASCKTKNTYVSLQTTKGEIAIKLYNDTPLHKENFISLVEKDYFDGVLFHRVINNFMIQTGDPNSKNAEDGELLGNGGPGYKIDAEFRDSLFHKKGAVAAARDNNPKKQSSGSQFYIVEGRTFNMEELAAIEKKNNVDYSEFQKETYTSIGGYPSLDKRYTVFGEVVKGMDTVEAISNVTTDENDRPVENVRILDAEIIKFKP